MTCPVVEAGPSRSAAPAAPAGPADAVDWALVDALVLVLALYRVYEGWVGHVLALIAIGAGSFDYFENFAVADMLRAGPEGVDAAMAAEASQWTMLKSASTTAAVLK